MAQRRAAFNGLFLPESAGSEAGILILARTLRAFGDGLISLVLPAYLAALGLNAFQIGLVATTTLFGSSLLTLGVGWAAQRVPGRRLLMGAALLMGLSGLGFAWFQDFWPLLLVAFVGTLNPSAGEASLFLPIEQARLAHSVSAADRTALFARYSFFGSLAAACGALAASFPEALDQAAGIGTIRALQIPFLLYAGLGLILALLYARLPRRDSELKSHPQQPLRKSRRVVLVLTALFSLDSFAGGFVVQSLLALWLFQRFGLDLATAGAIFFWTGLLSALSFLAAPWLARRIGLVNTMVFTHLPAGLCLFLVPFMPNLGWAVALLILRAPLSNLDVPTRNSYVMSVVTPPERAAAASLTAVPRSLAAAVSPALAGALLGASSFGWPLAIGGGLKMLYDVLLLWQFRHVGEAEDVASATTPTDGDRTPPRPGPTDTRPEPRKKELQ